MKKPKPIPTKTIAKKRRARPAKTRRVRNGFSVPCPECGHPSHVLRTTLGDRYPRARRRSRDFVVRERRCLSPAHHRFHTEERAR